MKTPVALMETGMVIHQTEEMEDHQEAEVVEEEVQVDHLPDYSNLQFPFKDHQEEESRSRPLMSLTETENKPRSSLTNSTCYSKETQISTKLMMPKWLQRYPISKDPMPPGGGKTRLTNFNMKTSHRSSFKRSLVQSSLQLTNSLMLYSGHMTLTSMTLKTSKSSMDGSLNSFNEVTLQINKPDSYTTRELCPHGSGAASLCLTHCLPLPVSG